MRNKIKDERFDLAGPAKDTEDEAFTTDFITDIDPIDQVIY